MKRPREAAQSPAADEAEAEEEQEGGVAPAAAPPSPTLVVHTPGDSVQLSDVHDLLAHALAPGVAPAPRWCSLSGGPPVRVVLLLLPGLDAALWRARGGAQPLAGLAALGEPVRVAAASPNPTPAAQADLALTLRTPFALQRCRAAAPAGAKADRADPTRRRATSAVPALAPSLRAAAAAAQPASAAAAFPPSFYALTPAEMADNNYPLPTATLTCPPGFVVTQPAGGGVARSPPPPLLAVDCEMVSTAEGLQLARVSVVDPEGGVVYDSLCLPPGPVLDYHTQHSGITEASLRGVTTCLAEVQAVLLGLVAEETLLVGHSLDNDLHALRLLHCRCVDTALLYPHPRGPPFKPALRLLAERLLQRSIQHTGVHDSVDDARATMALARLKFARGPAFGEARPGGVALAELCAALGARLVLVDRPAALKRHVTASAGAVAAASDAEAAQRAAREAGRPVGAGAAAGGAAAPALVVAHLADLGALHEARAQRARRRAEAAAAAAAAPGAEEEAAAAAAAAADAAAAAAALARADAAVAAVRGACPAGSLVLVLSPGGDTAEARRLLENKFRRAQGLSGGPWGDADEVALTAAQDRAKGGLLWAAVK